MVGHEGSRDGAAGDGLHHRRLDLDVARSSRKRRIAATMALRRDERPPYLGVGDSRST